MKYITNIFLLAVCSFATCFADDSDQKSRDISLDIRINCPMSDEYMEFFNTIPEAGNHSVEYEVWKEQFITSMTKLIELIESGKVNTSGWTVNTDVHEEPLKGSFNDIMP